MKNIFLSASIPLPERHPKYYDSADIIAIRDAVIALASLVVSKHRIIWGGHPSITPLIYYVIERTIQNEIVGKDWSEKSSAEDKIVLEEELKLKISKHIILYQSLFFKDKFIPDIDKFDNVVYTDNVGDIHSSIQLLRDQMLSDHKFDAAVFIGGMDGIEVEYNMFKEKHPNALILPIASTGAATRIIYDTVLPDEEKNERFVKDYGYMSLFQKYLMEKL
jgi:hypothetical protein